MAKTKDITGMKFGRLTAIKFDHVNEHRMYLWLCQCDCGNICVVNKSKLINGHTQSCGCLQRERASKAVKKHGMVKTKLYKTWQNMKNRCYYQKDKKYKDYGGRGITICNEWKNDFKVFYDWAMSNGYSDDLTIDRINTDGNYEPSNCRWTTWSIQRRNKRTTRNITFQGETHCITDWEKILGFKPKTLYNRLNKGYSVEVAFTTPVGKLKHLTK